MAVYYGYPPLPYFAGFTAFTPEVPKLYWDVKSQEQRYFMLCKELHKLICYADTLAERLNDISGDLEATIEQFKEEVTEQLEAQDKKVAEQLDAQNKKVDAALEEMRKYIDYRFDTIAEGVNVYDVTTGEYRPSQEAMRRLYSALAYDHTGDRAIVSNLARNMTVGQMAGFTTYYIGWSNKRDIIIDDQKLNLED